MIKSIHIKNFLSHADSSLELSNRVNIICGISNDGKSAIRRAINWVMSNRPLGDGLIRYYHKNGEKQTTKEATVELITNSVSGGLSVIRSKTSNSNGKYIIANGDSKIELKAFGQQVPNEVTNALNLSDINIQSQFSPYFLAFDSPGQVATFLRSITKLDEIDIICGLISGKIRNTQQEIEKVKVELCTVNAQIGELERTGLDKLEELIRETDVRIQNGEYLQSEVNKLSDIICRIDDLSKKSISLPDPKVIETIFEDVKACTDKWSTLTEKHQKLKSIINNIYEIKTINIPSNIDEIFESVKRHTNERPILLEKCQKLESIINGILGIGTINLDPIKVDGILKMKSDILEQYNKNTENHDRLLEIIEGINTADQSIAETSQKLEAENLLKTEIESKLTVCPISGKPCREMDNDINTTN